MRYFSKLLIAVVVLASFASSTLGQEHQITFWQFWKPSWLEPAIKRFEEENKPWKVKLERLTWSGGRRKLITAMAAKQAPDVMEIGSTWSPEFMSSGALLPLYDGGEELNLFHIDSGTYQNKIYGLPWTISVAGLYYNKDLLKKAGFDSPPRTWAELLEQSSKINNPSKKVYGFGVKIGAETTWQRFLPFAWSNGAKIVNNQGEVVVNRKNFIDALDFYNQLHQNGIMDSNLAIRKIFQQSKLGFVIEDPGQMANFKKRFPDLNFGVTSLPNAPLTGRHEVFGGAELLVVSSNTKHPDMASALVKFLVELENTKLITNKVTTLFPADKDGLKDDFYTKDNKNLQIFLNELIYARSTLVNPLWPEIQRSLVLNVEKMLYGRLSPSDAAKELDEQVKLILEDE